MSSNMFICLNVEPQSSNHNFAPMMKKPCVRVILSILVLMKDIMNPRLKITKKVVVLWCCHMMHMPTAIIEDHYEMDTILAKF